MNFNSRGFTLVELIVTVGIIGIITLIAFPAILKLQSSNIEVKYDAYMDSLSSNARVYIDNYEKDIFPEEEDNLCSVITYDMLYSNDLINDFDDEDISCAYNEGTFVKVSLVDEKYEYDASLLCKDEHGKEVFLEPKENIDIDSCLTFDKTSPIISIDGNDLGTYKQSHDFSIIVNDSSTLVENIKIKYAWSTDSLGSDLVESDYTLYNYQNNYGINEVKYSNSTKGHLGDVSGTWYLFVKPVNVVDTNENSAKDMVVSAKFNLDNSAPLVPIIDNQYNDVWINKNYSVNASSSDIHSGIDKWYYSYDLENWTLYKNLSGNTITTPDFSKERDNDVFIRVCDKANNCSYNSSSIKIDKTAPTCSVSGSNTEWTKNPVTLVGECFDLGGSQCVGNISKEISGNVEQGSPGIVYDNAGNSANCDEVDVYIDNVPPTCSTSIANNSSYDSYCGGYRLAEWANISVTVNSSCSDSGSGCLGNYSKVYAYDIDSDVTGGVVSDKVGNTTTCDSVHVQVDRTAPTFTISPQSPNNPHAGDYGNNLCLGDPVEVSYSANDSNSGIALMHVANIYYVKQDRYPINSFNYSTGDTKKFTYTFLNTNPQATHNATGYSCDKAGNRSVSNFSYSGYQTSFSRIRVGWCTY